jgi:hypothetical protein
LWFFYSSAKVLTYSLFVRLISHQPAVLFSQNKPATSNQPAVLFSQNKSAPAINHQPNEEAVSLRMKLSVLVWAKTFLSVSCLTGLGRFDNLS